MRFLVLALPLVATLAPQAALPPAVTVADHASFPHLAIDADGGLYAAFFRNGNIEVAFSTDHGKTFAPPVTAIDAGKTAEGADQRGPRIAVDKQKRVYVTAPLALDPKSPTQNDLYLAVSADRGKTFSKPLRINDLPGSAAASCHWTAITPAGELHVAWLDNRKQKGQDLHHARVLDQGKKIQRTGAVASQVCERCCPGLAVDPKGSPVFVYRDGAEKKSRQILFLSGPGAKPVQLNFLDARLTICPLDGPAVAVSTDGKVIASAWMDMRESDTDANVYYTFVRDGKPVSPDFRANDLAAFYQGRPSIALDADTTAWIAWEDGRHGVQRIYATDSKTRDNISVTGPKDPKGNAPSIVAQGSFVGVAYGLGENVAFRILAHDTR
jgi:hypothetical protein